MGRDIRSLTVIAPFLFAASLVGCGASEPDTLASGSGASTDSQESTKRPLEGRRTEVLAAGKSITFDVREVDADRKVELSVMEQQRQTEVKGVKIAFDSEERIVKFHASLLLDVRKPTKVTVSNLNEKSSITIKLAGVVVNGNEDLSWCRVDQPCSCSRPTKEGVCELVSETNLSSDDELSWMSADTKAKFGICNGCD